MGHHVLNAKCCTVEVHTISGLPTNCFRRFGGSGGDTLILIITCSVHRALLKGLKVPIDFAQCAVAGERMDTTVAHVAWHYHEHFPRTCQNC